MLTRLMEKVEPILSAPSPEAASIGFYGVMREYGASYLQTRAYRRPVGRLTSEHHWRAGGFVSRIAADGWVDSNAFNYICFECNPLLGAIREGRTRFRFSDFAPKHDRAYGAYWDALGEARIGNAFCSISYGPNLALASLHLGFPADIAEEISDAETLLIHAAGAVLTEHLLTQRGGGEAPPPRLTPRERDALALVAEGKTDWEISVMLSVSESTARFHVDNARRKLGAVNRAHAVARLIGQRLI